MTSNSSARPRVGVVAWVLAAALGLGAAAPALADPPVAVEDELTAARAPVSELARAGSEKSLGARFFRFRQEVAGVPVLAAEVVVSDPPGAAGTLLVDDTRAGVDIPPEPRLTRTEAVERARADAHVQRLRAEPEAKLAILPDDAGGQLGWRVVLPADEPTGDFEVLVDARSGAILRKRNLAVSAEGSARIFDPNAVVAKGDYESLADDNDQDSSLLTSLRSLVTLKRMTDADRCLKGAYAHATLPSGDVCSSSDARDFQAVTRSEGEFEALMAYFHVDRAQAYIQSLGFANVNNRQTPVEANAVQEDNSFYYPSTDRIELGEGGVDDGEDGEVILHEYGHAVQDNQVPGFGQSFDSRAMGEGFGDYLAAATSSQLPNSTAEFNACIFEWDTWGSASQRQCLRRLDLDLTLAEAQAQYGNSPHGVGQAWSGALWDLRQQLGKDASDRFVMDRLVLQSHFALTPGASFDDGARALLSADESLYNGTHEPQLRSLLTDRGFVDTTVSRTLTLSYSKSAAAFRGAISSVESSCEQGQTVTVKRKRSGPDEVIGQATTNAAGDYTLPKRRRAGRYYANVPQVTRPNGSTCLAARSPTLTLS